MSHGDLSSALVFDAVRVRLIEIGEAVKGITPATLTAMPDIPMGRRARMRDHLAHRHLDTTHSTVQGTVANDLPELEDASVAHSIATPVRRRTPAQAAPPMAANLSGDGRGRDMVHTCLATSFSLLLLRDPFPRRCAGSRLG